MFANSFRNDRSSFTPLHTYNRDSNPTPVCRPVQVETGRGPVGGPSTFSRSLWCSHYSCCRCRPGSSGRNSGSCTPTGGGCTPRHTHVHRTLVGAEHNPDTGYLLPPPHRGGSCRELRSVLFMYRLYLLEKRVHLLFSFHSHTANDGYRPSTSTSRGKVGDWHTGTRCLRSVGADGHTVLVETRLRPRHVVRVTVVDAGVPVAPRGRPLRTPTPSSRSPYQDPGY